MGVSSQFPGSDGTRRGAVPDGRGTGGGLRRGFGSTVFGIRSGEAALAWLFFPKSLAVRRDTRPVAPAQGGVEAAGAKAV